MGPPKCPTCQTQMKALFLVHSFYCPNDCDKPKKQNVTDGTFTVANLGRDYDYPPTALLGWGFLGGPGDQQGRYLQGKRYAINAMCPLCGYRMRLMSRMNPNLPTVYRYLCKSGHQWDLSRLPNPPTPYLP